MLSPDCRSQDSIFVANAVASGSPAAADVAWEFFKTRWDTINEQVLKGSGMLSAVLVGVFTKSLLRREVIEDVLAFFAKNPCPPAARNLQQSLETIQARLGWLERDRQDVEAFLKR